MADINILTAFGAGIISFISPCVLPVYPAFLSYITGVTIQDLKTNDRQFRKSILLHTIAFLIGFSIVYLAIGFASSFFGQFFIQYKEVIRIVGAVLIIGLGMVISGIFQPDFLMQTKRFEFRKRPVGYFGTILIGLTFAAGWTPCMGPTLGYVLTITATNPSSGFIYMVSYLLGFAIPFLLSSFFVGRMNWLRKYAHVIMKIGGWTMILMGFLLLLNWLPKLTNLFYNIFS